MILRNIIIVLVKQKHRKGVIQENLKEANHTVKEQLFGAVEINMQVNIKKVCPMAKELTRG